MNNTFATFDRYLNRIAGLNPILRQDTHCPQSLIGGQNNTVLEKMGRQLTHLEIRDCKFTEFSEDVFELIN